MDISERMERDRDFQHWLDRRNRIIECVTLPLPRCAGGHGCYHPSVRQGLCLTCWERDYGGPDVSPRMAELDAMDMRTPTRPVPHGFYEWRGDEPATGTVTVWKSMALNGIVRADPPIQQLAPLRPALAVHLPEPVAPAKNGYYAKKRHPVVRSAGQLDHDRNHVLALAARHPEGFTAAQLVHECYGKGVPAADRHATNLRDDLRFICAVGLIERISDNPMVYRPVGSKQ